MPRKRPISEWKPAGIELLREAGKLYSNDDLERFFVALDVSTVSRKEVAKKIRRTVERLYEALHYRGRPRVADKRTALKALLASLSNTIAAFDSLDSDSLGLLCSTASTDQRNEQTEPPFRPWDLGELRLDTSVGGIKNLQRWAEAAFAALPDDKGGRTSFAAIKTAVRELQLLWTKCGMKRGKTREKAAPKLRTSKTSRRKSGPFLDFCRSVLNPVLARFNIDTDLEATVADVLYGEKRSP